MKQTIRLVMLLTVVVLVRFAASGSLPTGPGNYGLLADSELRLRDATIRAGGVGVNRGELLVTHQLDAKGTVEADSVHLSARTHCGALIANHVLPAAPGCGPAAPFAGPIVSSLAEACGVLVPAPPCDSTAESIVVGHGERRTLAPGRYGALVITGGGHGAGALELSGGDYSFCDVRLARDAAVTATAPSTLMVLGRFATGNGSEVGGPAPVRVLVAGSSARLSRRTKLIGDLCAPSARLSIADNVMVEGCLAADRIVAQDNLVIRCEPGTTTTTTTRATSTTASTSSTSSTTTPSSTTTTAPTSSTTTGSTSTTSVSTTTTSGPTTTVSSSSTTTTSAPTSTSTTQPTTTTTTGPASTTTTTTASTSTTTVPASTTTTTAPTTTVTATTSTSTTTTQAVTTSSTTTTTPSSTTTSTSPVNGLACSPGGLLVTLAVQTEAAALSAFRMDVTFDHLRANLPGQGTDGLDRFASLLPDPESDDFAIVNDELFDAETGVAADVNKVRVAFAKDFGSVNPQGIGQTNFSFATFRFDCADGARFLPSDFRCATSQNANAAGAELTPPATCTAAVEPAPAPAPSSLFVVHARQSPGQSPKPARGKHS